LDIRVVQADNHSAVERDLVDELDEGVADGVERWVVVEMLAIDVGDDGDDGGELEKGAVALVGFDDEKIAVAHAGVGAAHGPDAAADHDGGIEPGVVENGGGHRGSSGFTVAAGDGYAVFQAHQLGQQFAAGDHRDLQAARFLHFGVLLVDGGAHD